MNPPSPAPAISPSPTAKSSRLPWIDHLRTAVIFLVVNVHACVTYSHVGDWYVMSAQEPTLRQKLPFIVWESHLQSFFMGLLFFISGYFAWGALARRTTGAFVRERLRRLGLPTLFFMLVIHPFILLVLNPWNAKFGPPLAFYRRYLLSGRFLSSTGPLWFAFALLIFCLIFAGIRAAGSKPTPVVAARTVAAKAPTGIVLALFALALGLGSFAVRLVQPIGTNVLNFQLCFFVQYVAFFLAGLSAAKSGWLLPLSASRQARLAGWLVLFIGPVVGPALMALGVRGGHSPEIFFGGWHWQALGFALWEQLTGVGLSLALLAFFSSRLNRDTPTGRWLADRSFGVYVLHTPVIIALFMVYRALPQNLYALPVLLTVTGLFVSYVLADLFRRIPVLRAIF
jgi:peptidoglycan/LPS O-acetylase OafA/YrhL